MSLDTIDTETQACYLYVFVCVPEIRTRIVMPKTASQYEFTLK